MKTRSTFKNRLTPHFFFLSALILLISTPVFSQVKHLINVTKNKFTPQVLTIAVGDTVEWRNTDGFHNVNGMQSTYPMNPESFGNNTGTGWTFSHVFTMSGKYDYQCDPHVGLGMVGTIEVAGSGPMKHIVEVTRNKFTPANLMINAGDTVEWRNVDGFHNVNGNQTTYPMNPESFRNGDPANTNWTFSHVFTMSGKYDYQCDPHEGLGMVGTIEVAGKDDNAMKTLTVNFSGMNPHVGQTLWLAVIDKDSGIEIERKSVIVTVDFSIQIPGLEMNHSYNVDFFADHNKNGVYDAPPADHAWRMEVIEVMGDAELNFQHNTNFTDIMWRNKLTVHFTGMNPHVGQTLQLAVIDKNSGMEVQRVSIKAEADFMIDVFGMENGMSYNVDFFSDHNKNGQYDAPPADHAWRLELNNVMGDTTLNFQHNTSFTDIMWKNKLIVHFMGMTPHVGQNLQLAVIDKNSGMEIHRVSKIVETEFMIEVPGIENGMSYNVDFFSDHNKNGQYDAPPADHAWRLELNNVMGDTILNFQHNTNFTDINWITTSVDNMDFALLKIYPNPAAEKVFIETGEFQGSEIQVSVYTISGKLEYQKTGQYKNKIEIDVQNFANGIYLIHLRANDKQQ
ncbi:MAG TPA: plastocyanin/azurin family copper-binding protein, partial [Draconibacterium sp.]|nr:plastocyanin/azurin family copper-binding protein [Draconibacterium sp.]